MKKSFIAIAMALTFGFVWAVALCVRALGGAQSVSAFDERVMRIVVDAGHGGIDGGVTGKKTGVKESELNLEISFFLRDALEEAGFEVVLTRKTDAGLYGTTAKGFKKRDMQRRKEIILDADPALVISVHQNLYPTKTQRGAQVFFGTDNENSRLLAGCIQAQMNDLYAEKGVKNRTASKGDFFILHCAPCPSVIVECGFLSNAQDEELLLSKTWQKRLASSIVTGVVGYLADGAA
jgi:N-acetylmuramoyl-L-alanine amidase